MFVISFLILNLIQKLIHNISFLIQKLKKIQFLDAETKTKCQFLFWIQILRLWISFCVQTLTVWARGT